MTGYAYVHVDSIDTETEMDLVQKYAGHVSINIDEVLSDTQPIKKHWSERLIGEKLTTVFQPGDHLFVYEASQLACSTSQLLEIMNMMADKNIHLYFIKYNMHMENASQQIDTQKLLRGCLISSQLKLYIDNIINRYFRHCVLASLKKKII